MIKKADIKKFISTPIIRLWRFFLLLTTALMGFMTQLPIVYGDVLSDQLDQARQSTDVTSFVDSILNFSIAAGTIALVALIIHGGYKMMTSQGNPEAIAEAREIITNAVLGFLLIAMSVGILLLIGDVFQIPFT